MAVAAVHPALAKKRFDEDVRNLNPELASRLGLTIHSAEYPVWDVTVEHIRPVRLIFTAPDWNETPPSIAICKPDGEPMTDGIPGGLFNATAHDRTGRPFVCMAGSLEFHTHSSHVNETWEGFKGKPGKTLTGILLQLASGWREIVN
jgi:hypothetical protein